MLKVALAGVGGISSAHIPAWESFEDTELVAICDIQPKNMEQYPAQHKYTCIDEMLEKEDLNILDICLPTFLHAEVAEKAMRKGIHVVCEKPISLNIEDVDRLYKVAEENSVSFMVAQVLRFWPEYELIKELFDTKKYGKLLYGSMERIGCTPTWSWNDWMSDEKLSGLVPFDLHVHDLDFIVHAFGAPTKTALFQSKILGQNALSAVYDFGDFYIQCESAHYACSKFPFRANFRFMFENAVVENMGVLKIYESDGNIIDFAAEGGVTGNIQLPQTNAYTNELRYFADCVKSGNKPTKVKPEELKEVLKLLCAFPKCQVR